MSSSRRTSLKSIENTMNSQSGGSIELRVMRESLLPSQPTARNDPEVSSDVEETSPFPLNIDSDQAEETAIRGDVNEESDHQERRGSATGRRSNRRNRRLSRGIFGEFFNLLFPRENRSAWYLPITVTIIILMLMIIGIVFVVLGYTTVEYDEFGVTRNTWTGTMDLKHPYSAGFHIILPWEEMITFDKTARYLEFDRLSIFTTDQASVTLDVAVVYRVRPEQIESIWLNFAAQHERVLKLVAENVLRNHGNRFSIFDYRARREHVEHQLSLTLQQTLSGDCCLSCCHSHTCSKTIEYSCSQLKHCREPNTNCSTGYFVDIDAVYIYGVSLPLPIIKRLHILMLRPLFTEIAESQESTAVIRIETEKLRNEFLNQARKSLMSAAAESELIREKARAQMESRLLKQLASSERHVFQRLNINRTIDRLSASFLLEFSQLKNMTRLVDLDSFVADQSSTRKYASTNDIFDFVQPSDVFNLSEFFKILDL